MQIIHGRKPYGESRWETTARMNLGDDHRVCRLRELVTVTVMNVMEGDDWSLADGDAWLFWGKTKMEVQQVLSREAEAWCRSQTSSWKDKHGSDVGAELQVEQG